jgi:hypothetical protein
MIMKLKHILQLACFLILLAQTSCKKLVDVNAPITSISDELVFTNDATATATVTGIYLRMSGTQYGFASGGLASVTLFAALSADELINFPESQASNSAYFYSNTLLPDGIEPELMWAEMYQYIYTANVVIEKLTDNTAITPVVRQQLTGEAKFIRAFCYFYLSNLFGNVPLLTSSDYRQNSVPARSSQAAIYSQMITDLKDAQALLKIDYSISATQERVKPNKWAATALLARVYLFNGQWSDAEEQATAVINNASLYAMPNLPYNANASEAAIVAGLNTVFLKNSRETIWALKPVLTNANTPDASTFWLPLTGPASASNSAPLSESLVASFEPGDKRVKAWTGSVKSTANGKTYFSASKYKVITTTSSPVAAPVEYSIVLRLSEQYLIRAEARARLLNMGGASADLNVVRNAAGLPNTIAADLPSLLTAILNERRVEFFTEWGHRWLDLKRTKTIDAVMSVATPIKGGVWNTNYQLYPIPQKERGKNVNLTQNPGYN